MIVLLIAGGLLALVVGAEALVRGASRLAAGLGISPLVVGLTIVAFGTSAPELGVSLDASLKGDPSIALGNVVGSNIFNILVILGLSSLVTPLVVAVRMVRIEVPVMIAVSAVLWLLARDGRVGTFDGVALLVGLAGYLLHMVRTARDQAPPPAPDPIEAPRKWRVDLSLIAAGLLLLVLGSGWFVDGARQIATQLGVSDLVIGLTVVAAGTSLPELATSVLAAARGQRDIAVGNVVGSNLFNILAILGITSLVSKGGVPVEATAVAFDLPVLFATAAICLPVFLGGRIGRGAGALFLAGYLAYGGELFLEATAHPAQEGFRLLLAWIGIPLAVGLVIGGILGARRRR